MKFFCALIALVAASTTPQPTTGQSTAADSVTVPDVDILADDVVDILNGWYSSYMYDYPAMLLAACIETQDDLAASTNEIEINALLGYCEIRCDGLEGQSCVAPIIEAIDINTNGTDACTEAQEALAAAQNPAEAFALQVACQAECANVEGETCGFLLNGISLAIFAILAFFEF